MHGRDNTVFALFLGFLSTMDEHAPGNYGLMDILEALRFLEKYIADFGGNPNNITLGGYGPGASAAALLTLSPKSKISTCELYICNIVYHISQRLFVTMWGPIRSVSAKIYTPHMNGNHFFLEGGQWVWLKSGQPVT